MGYTGFEVPMMNRMISGNDSATRRRIHLQDRTTAKWANPVGIDPLVEIANKADLPCAALNTFDCL